MKSAVEFLGYDCRRRCIGSSPLWQPDRRSLYLLRPDVAEPLSVDGMVWPSIFESRSLSKDQEAAVAPMGPRIKRPEWIGLLDPFWESLTVLLQHCGDRPQTSIVAVSCPSHPYHEHGTSKETPAGASWRSIGFDVADEFQTSGLMNCGYLPDEIAPLQREFASSLNESHLFSKEEDAHRFARTSDSRVVEHAPFFVYQLFLLESSSS